MTVQSHNMEAVRAVTVAAPAGGSLGDIMAAGPSAADPFSGARITVLDRLSQRILGDAELRRDAASVALGFWLRRASVTRMAEELLAGLRADAVLAPAGGVFHIAPANVDTLFVYSWALSFLCGNRNIVRLSTRTGGAVQRLIAVIGALMAEEPLLARENAFVQYERSDEINEALSLWCQHRIVWGGDETVNALRRVKLNPHASERAFASKFSWSVLRAAAWLALDPAGRAALAEKFYNDAFWFDQLACSSPQVIVWAGTKAECSAAAAAFDAVLAEVVQRKQADDVSAAVQRRNRAFSVAVEPGMSFDLHQTGMTSVHAAGLEHVDKESCGGGFFIHAPVETLTDAAAFVTERDQTVSHFGFSEEELRAFAVHAGARGLDRIVPVGEALQFAPVWDGYNLLHDFTRQVTVRPGKQV